MSNPIDQPPAHPDQLLPWWVNNTLPPDERKVVEDHLRGCAQCTKEVRLLQQIKEQVQELPIQSPGQFGLRRFLTEVNRDKEVNRLHQRTSSRWRRSGLAMAASFIIILQAGLLLNAWWFSKPVVPLSGPEVPGVVLQITFAPTATEAQIRESVTAVAGTFVDGPGELGVYRLRLSLPSDDLTSVTQAIEYLRTRKDIVTHVAQE